MCNATKQYGNSLWQNAKQIEILKIKWSKHKALRLEGWTLSAIEAFDFLLKTHSKSLFWGSAKFGESDKFISSTDTKWLP